MGTPRNTQVSIYIQGEPQKMQKLNDRIQI